MSEKLSKEELENVVGGSQCRNGSFYSSDPPYYLIVTLGNSCPGYTNDSNHGFGVEGTCAHCISLVHHEGDLAYYCQHRFYDNDPYNPED